MPRRKCSHRILVIVDHTPSGAWVECQDCAHSYHRVEGEDGRLPFVHYSGRQGPKGDVEIFLDMNGGE